MIDSRPVLFVAGVLLSVMALAMIAPLLVDLAADNADWEVFAMSAGFCLGAGVLLLLTNRAEFQGLDLRQAIVLTVAVWIVLPGVGALPMAFADLGLSYTDAFFEAMSGITTTGSTVIVGLDGAPPGLLLWRAILQWIGGVGIIVMGIAILPVLRVGGMQIFRMESSDQSDKVLPDARRLVVAILAIYSALSLACALAYRIGGMGWFDSLAHAMTTVATGGFSTHDASFAHFDALHLAWIAVLFMLLGATSFPLVIRAMRGDAKALWTDPQLRAMLAIAAAATLALVAWRLAHHPDTGLGTAFTAAAFSAVSILTTTGFAIEDYQLWGAFPTVLFFMLTFVGGTSGSTAGGFKLFRLIVLVKVGATTMKRLLLPNGVFVSFYGDRPISDAVAASVMGFGALWVASWLAIALGLSLTGLDLVTSLSGAATAIANVGPGLGEAIGPAGNFAALPDAAKWILAGGMLLGRLELLTVLVVILPRFWRG